MLILLMFNQVNATEYSSELPGGKNYLDINNYTNHYGELNQVDPIRLLPDTDYVISVPPEDYLQNMEIHIIGDTTYVSGLASELSNCVLEADWTYCTFHTSTTETLVTVNFFAFHMDYHYNNFEIRDFQLEVGTYPTSYEQYILPTDNTSPEIAGEGAFITSYESVETLSSIVDAHFTASDDIDGDLTQNIQVIYDEYTGNEQTVGSYNVTLEVSDSSQNTAQYPFTVIVKDTLPPEITGPTQIEIDVNSPPTIESILMDYFTFNDGYDGALTPEITSDNYTVNKTTIGTYQVTVEVSDSSFNTSTHTVNISVVDITPPTLNQTSEIEVLLSSPITSDTLISGLLWQDNYDDASLLTVTEISNTYRNNEATVGDYTIELEVKDMSGNTSNEIITITVSDDIIPIITGPNTLSVSYTKQLTHTEILDLFTVTDEGSSVGIGDTTITDDLYSSQSSTIGDYSMTITVTDPSGNKATHQLILSVIDDIPPVIYADEFLVTVEPNTVFDENDMLLLMMQNGEISEQSYDITTLINEYEGNETNAGTYQYSVVFKGEDGTTLQKDFIIRVLEDDSVINSSLLWRNVTLYTLSVGLIIGTVLISKKH